ncbi:MAG: hypothetical protein Q4F17_11095 [Eubacteriales bacterium]|nr:hypothetical protein [Eubacteriales bacterium]
MAKQGMARPDWTKLHPKNDPQAVPQLQGKAKTGRKKANPIIPGTEGADLKVFHEKPIPEQIYPVLDTDLARDNVENDLTMADLQDL